MNGREISPLYRWLTFSITGSGIFLATSAVTIVNVALPFITQDFGSELAATQWVVLVYLLTTSSFLINFGRLGDIFTPYRIHYVGLIVFTVASLLCSFAGSVEALVAVRALQGLGGAMIVSNSPGTVTAVFPPERRGRILGLQVGLVGCSLSIGPTLAGFLIGLFGWRAVFLYNVPFGILGILVGWLIPTPGREGRRVPIDAAGGVLLFASVITFVLGISTARNLGWSSPQVMVLLAVSVLCTAGFLCTEKRVRHPMLDLGLFRNRVFAVAQAGNFLSHMAGFGVFLLMPFYLVRILKLSAQDSGLILLPLTIATVLLGPVAGILGDRFGAKSLSLLGMALTCSGLYALTSLDENSSILGVILRLALVGAGRAVYQSPNTSATLGSASKERLGVAGGVHATMRHLGNLSGIAVVGNYFNAREAARLANLPRGGVQGDLFASAFMASLRETFFLSLGIAALALVLTLFQKPRRRGT